MKTARSWFWWDLDYLLVAEIFGESFAHLTGNCKLLCLDKRFQDHTHSQVYIIFDNIRSQMHLYRVWRLIFQQVNKLFLFWTQSVTQAFAFASANLITDSMCLTVIGMDPVAIDSRLKSEYIFETFALSISSFGFIWIFFHCVSRNSYHVVFHLPLIWKTKYIF